MILISKEITQWFVKPTLRYISKNLFLKKQKLVDLYKIGPLTLSRIDKTPNEKIYFLWDKEEEKEVLDFEMEGGKNELRILKIKRHFKALSKQEKLKYSKLRTLERARKNVIKCPEFIKGYLIIEKKKRGWAAWQVIISYVNSQYRGLGLGKQLYDAVITHDDLMLMTDFKQTENAKSLWESFIRSKRYNIWAQDIHNLENKSLAFWDKENNEVYSNLSIWHKDGHIPREKIKEDVRLIALANRT